MQFHRSDDHDEQQDGRKSNRRTKGISGFTHCFEYSLKITGRYTLKPAAIVIAENV